MKFDQFQTSSNNFQQVATTGNNTQQHKTWCAIARNMLGPTLLGLVGQQCFERLHGPLRMAQEADRAFFEPGHVQ